MIVTVQCTVQYNARKEATNVCKTAVQTWQNMNSAKLFAQLFVELFFSQMLRDLKKNLNIFAKRYSWKFYIHSCNCNI